VLEDESCGIEISAAPVIGACAILAKANATVVIGAASGLTSAFGGARADA
jgi:hypothetical protein